MKLYFSVSSFLIFSGQERNLGIPVVVFSLVDKIRDVLYNYPNGNVSKIYKDNTLVREYIYDQYDRLTWEKNYTANFEYSYVYDSNGNLTKKSRATKSSNNSTTSEITFMYGYNGDKMVSITTTFSDIPGVSSSQNFTYDALGNPTKHNGKALEWQGRKLTKVGDTTMQYDYNGLRTRKGERYYYWLGNTLKMERWGENTIYYYYDESGISGFRYDDKEYYYHKNIFGDVVAIYDKNKDLQATYEYDAWGNHTVTNATDDNIGDVNPIRYRGYYYDVETQLFYCNSRYYSPELCRFIQPADVSTLNPRSINGLNLYSFANNNPIGIAYSSFGATFGTSGGMIGSTRGTIGNIVGSRSVGGGSKISGFGSLGGSSFSSINWPKANSVAMTHYTTSLIKNPFISWMLGNISYTKTVQLNSAETFYSFSNIGNDGYSAGVGFNFGNWYGGSVYVSSDIGFGSSWQLTPWLTGSSGWSLENGISISGGVIIGDTTHEITVSIGNGALLGYAACAGIAAIPVPGARAVAATAACIIFIIDLFN